MSQAPFSVSMRHVIASLLLIGISGAFILFFYSGTHTYGGIPLAEDAGGIAARSREIVHALGLEPEQFTDKTAMMSDLALLERVYSRHNGDEANRLLREVVPAYYWKVRLLRAGSGKNLLIGSKAGDEEKILRHFSTGDLMMQFDGNGRLLRIDVPMDDSLAAPALTAAEAYDVIRRLLLPRGDASRLAPIARLDAFADTGATTQGGIHHIASAQPERIDHLFVWTVYDEALGDTVDVRAAVKGNVLARFESIPRFTRTFDSEHGTGIADIFEVAYYAVFGIVLVVVFFRRMRSYEIGFRTAIYMGVTIALLFGAWLFFELNSQMDPTIELLLPLVIAPLFVGGGFVPLWAVSESLGRETWKDKLISFDLLRAGHVFHSRIGRALLWGAAGGAAMLAVGLLSARAFDGIDTTWIRHGGGDGLRPFSAPSAVLYIIGNATISALFAAAFMLLSIVSLARQRLQIKALVIVIPALLFTIVDGLNLVPLPTAWLVLLPAMLLLVWLFVETDLLTALAAMIVFSVLSDGTMFFLPGSGAWQAESMTLAGAFTLLLAWGVAALLTPDRVTDLEGLAPRYQRHITERQRLARELEIAREVQMSFLPKRNPIIVGLDIASHCAPALEVGGDYYDFIELGEGRIGIAIGDVSGKGTQAAFYMTLTKGFLQALAWQHESPAAVLVEMNRLFYRNVERGHFISMIYAVFDMNTRELHIARAGHTPVMRRRNGEDVDVIHSRGIALGFEAGETFTATIEEVTVPLHTGDTFLLYTDGYPETMTRTREEFGEERLASALRDFGGSSSEELLSQLYRDTRRFAGRNDQHDDMTMVVVRVR